MTARKRVWRRLARSIKTSYSIIQETRNTSAACHGSGNRSLRSPRSRCVLRLRRYRTNPGWNVLPSEYKKHKSASQDRVAPHLKSGLS